MDRPEPALARTARVAELDALRGIAALSVVLYHYTVFLRVMFPAAPSLPFAFPLGCYGVQCFFAISGFVILMTLERTRRAGDFVRARFLRLFPTYWLAMAVTLAVVAWIGPAKLQVPGWAIPLNLPMLHVFMGVPPIDGAYWSLNIELAFYAAMLLLWRLRLLGRIEQVLAGWIALKWLWWLLPGLPDLVGLAVIQDHIPWFAVGILAYRVWSGERRWIQQLPVLAFAFVSVLVIDPVEPRWVFIAITMVMFALAAGRLRGLGLPLLLWLGAVSYPLYLLHAFIGYSLILRLEAMGVAPLLATAMALACVLALAALVVEGFERPLRAAMRRRAAARHFAAATPELTV